MVPVKLLAQMPLALVHKLNPFIVEVADIVIELNEAPPVTVNPVVVALPKLVLPETFKAPS